MAWRNVWRNRRRTVVTVAAMTVGLGTMIVASGMAEGMLRDLEKDVLDLEAGDVQIVADDYRENPSLYTRIEDPDALLAQLDAAGLPASARLLAFGLAAGEDTASGASFFGVDVKRDARVSLVYEQVERGEWLRTGDPKGVVLGRRLARTLGVDLGDELVVLSQAADGSMANELFTVRGVLRGIAEGIDRSGIFMSESAFRELMVMPEGAHLIVVRRTGELDLAAAAELVHELAPGKDVKTWRELMPTIASYVDSARSMIFAMSFIIFIAIGILILNAMLMAVFERVRELGVLKALGVSPGQVLLLILAETAIQTVLAIGVGLALAIPPLLYLTWVGIDLGRLAGVTIMGMALNPIWRAELDAQAVTRPIVALVAIVGFAVLYPALKAALIRPVDAIHHQ